MRNNHFFDLISSNFLLNRSATNSDTDLYPNSGCSLINFTALSNRALGILGEPYFFDIQVKNEIHKFNGYATYLSQNINIGIILLHICNIRVAI